MGGALGVAWGAWGEVGVEGGLAGKIFEKKAFEKFQFQKISVPDVCYLTLRDLKKK